jgi:hypothetical protein
MGGCDRLNSYEIPLKDSPIRNFLPIQTKKTNFVHL